ncbi:hypothetical protein ACFW2I_35090 [Streptomyces nigra]|uniref:hypothetical protein n=1 Tax=Streptomyces nigra TaxID=1827580 RepID=UPI00368E2B4A
MTSSDNGLCPAFAGQVNLRNAATAGPTQSMVGGLGIVSSPKPVGLAEGDLVGGGDDRLEAGAAGLLDVVGGGGRVDAGPGLDAAAYRVQAAPAGEVQQPPGTAGVGREIGAGQDGADGAGGGCGEGVAVGVDADDAVDVFCAHGHAVVLLRADDRDGVGLGGVTTWRNCDESRRKADKLLIKPTGGPCRRPRPDNISGERP